MVHLVLGILCGVAGLVCLTAAAWHLWRHFHEEDDHIRCAMAPTRLGLAWVGILIAMFNFTFCAGNISLYLK